MGNVLEAARQYRQYFSRRHVPDQEIFERLYQCLCEEGSFVPIMHYTGCVRSVWTGQVVDNILQRVENLPGMGTGEVSCALNVSHSTVSRVLLRERLPVPYTENKRFETYRLCTMCRVCVLVFESSSSAA